MIFTYYPNKESHQPHYFCISELEKLIQSGTTVQAYNNYRQGIITKEDLPIILPSARMKAGAKNAMNITDHSQLIWLDVDTCKNADIDINKLLQQLNQDEYTYYTWHSPRQGLRIVVYTNCSLQNHLDYWHDIVYHYETKYNITVDSKCKAINSFCFLNSDDNIYVNTYSTTYNTIQYKDKWEKVSKAGIVNNNNIRGFDTFSTDTYLYHSTPIDEGLFTDKQQPLYVAGGLDYAEIRLFKDLIINEGSRNRTIGRFCLALLYNNPQVEFKRLLKLLNSINREFCKPRMDAKDVHSICKANYERHKQGKLDFSSVVRKKYVFYSKEFKGVQLTPEQESELSKQLIQDNELKLKMLRNNKHKMSMECLKQGRQAEYEQRIYEAIEALKNATNVKVTYKQIANWLGVGEQVIKRRITNELKNYLKS
jgi:hypothetical protein